MTHTGRKLLSAVLVLLGIMLLAGGAATAAEATGADLKLSVFCPNFQNDVQFNITIKVFNRDPLKTVTFNRVVVASLNPDMTIKGPYLASSVARTVNPRQTLTFTIPYRITTVQPVGTVVPVLVTLWDTYYTTGYQRGAGVGAAYKSK